MPILINILISGLAVFATAYILPGVHVAGFGAAVVAAIVLGLVSAIVKPILVFLTLPLTIFTLGLFLLVINAVTILIVDALVPGFEVDGFWWALIFAFVVSLVSSFLQSLT